MIQDYTKPQDPVITRLLMIWESAVRVTHTFLAEEDIQKLLPLVKLGIEQVEVLFCAQDEKGLLRGFIGVSNEKIEMLFVDNEMRGKGIGQKLVGHVLKSLPVKYVDVNEQNLQAIGFYEHVGFQIFSRSPLDEQGNPFPILHMKFKNP